jgi:hypothetical protein
LHSRYVSLTAAHRAIFSPFRRLKPQDTKMTDIIRDIVARASAAAFGGRLIQNNLRSMILEAMVAKALGSSWCWCSADWAPFDFEGPNGVRLEVKQSAAEQTWPTPKPSKAVYDIAARTGYYDGGSKWTASPGRNADLYIFARNETVGELANHCDPAQWRFYVVPTCDLPNTKTIGIAAIRTAPVTFDQLEQRVLLHAKRLPGTPRRTTAAGSDTSAAA